LGQVVYLLVPGAAPQLTDFQKQDLFNTTLLGLLAELAALEAGIGNNSISLEARFNESSQLGIAIRDQFILPAIAQAQAGINANIEVLQRAANLSARAAIEINETRDAVAALLVANQRLRDSIDEYSKTGSDATCHFSIFGFFDWFSCIIQKLLTVFAVIGVVILLCCFGPQILSQCKACCATGKIGSGAMVAGRYQPDTELTSLQQGYSDEEDTM
jgi:hypothetical protein